VNIVSSITSSIISGTKKRLVYLYDTFTDVDGTLSGVHTPDVGAAAKNFQGVVAQIQGNKLTAMGKGWNWTGWAGKGGVAKRYEVDISANKGAVWIGMRYQNNQNALRVYILRNAVQLVEIIGGATTNLFYIPHTFNAAQASLIVEDDGLTISVWYNGVFVTSVQSSSLNGVNKWFLNLVNAGTAVNSFKVTEL